jgi:hypothetical protein
MPPDYTMPFGRHRGRALADLPDGYFAWLRTLDLREPLRSAVAEEVERRDRQRPDPRVVEDLIAAGQRALARRHHPDAGGSHDAMISVRLAADWLFERAARLRGIAA